MTSAGKTNSPEPNIADSEIITTENNPSFLSRVSETMSIGLKIVSIRFAAVNLVTVTPTG